MRSILFALVFGALSTTAFAGSVAPAPVKAPALSELSAAGSALALDGQAVRFGDRTGFRTAPGAADELGLSVGSYELEDRDGGLSGELRVRADGSLVVLPGRAHSADSHARLGSVSPIVIIIKDDGECTEYTIIIDNEIFVFYDCTIIVTA